MIDLKRSTIYFGIHINVDHAARRYLPSNSGRDRSTWPRSLKALEQSDPNLVQLMPAPMLSHLSKQDRNALPPIVASGFVCNKGDVFDALKNGAAAVSTSDSEWWKLDPER